MTSISTIQVVPFHTDRAHGYNPSLVDYNGRRLTSYRYHPAASSWRTQLVIQCNGQEKPVILPEKYKDYSHEDMRFFIFNGHLMASLTVARSRVSGQSLDPCIQAYGKLEERECGWMMTNWVEPKHPDNTWSKQSKNVVFRQSGKNLTMTWATYPNHVVHLLDAQGNLVTGWRTESPKCPFGTYRGGTQSFPFDGKRLRFCHAVQNNPKTPLYWHYHLAAYLFEPDPPFRIVKVSQMPIMSGNEQYEAGVAHQKANICICYGAIKQGDNYLVSLGLNDKSCAIAEIQPSDLNL